MGICNFFLPPAIPLHFLFHFIFISSHLLSFTPLNYFHPSLLVLYHYYCPTDYKKAAVLSRLSSGICSPQQQWFMWSFFISPFFSCVFWKARSWPQWRCCASSSLCLHCPHQQFPAQGHRVHLRCTTVYRADATGIWFAVAELIVTSSPSLNLSFS